MKSLPVVKEHPLQQLLGWTFNPLQFLDDCAAKYGDVFVAKIGPASPNIVLVSNPAFLAELFAPGNAEKLDSGRAQVLLKMPMGELSTLVSDGAPHRRKRQLLMPPFHGDRMKAYGNDIRQITEEVCSQWVPGQPFEMLETMNALTLRVILTAIFGLYKGERCEQIEQRLNAFLDVIASPITYLPAVVPFLRVNLGFWNPVGAFFETRDRVDELLFAEIRDRRQNFDPSRPDILTLLLMAKDETGEGMEDQELRDELMTMLLAGHDSSASTISWAFSMILSHPEVKQRLLAELDGLGDTPDPAAISKLPYLSAVCSEVLRRRAAGPTVAPRISNAPIQIQGYDFPEDTTFLPCHHLTHHREDLYPEPEKFMPERFLDRTYGPNEYFPFGGGNRRCIGATFANYEMKIVLATLLRRYDLQLAQKMPIKAVRRGVNISPQGGVKVVMTGTRTPARAVAEVASLL
jgi:unspecific monooxygenase